MLKYFQNLTAQQRVFVYTLFDVFFSWVIPVILVATQYDLFAYQESQSGNRATAILYILFIAIAFGLIWRAKEIVKLTKSNGLRYALMRSSTPFLFIFFWMLLGQAEGNIDRLQFIFFWSAPSHLIAIYFRFLVGRATKTISNENLAETIKVVMKDGNTPS
jgi:hypothetical protein